MELKFDQLINNDDLPLIVSIKIFNFLRLLRPQSYFPSANIISKVN